MCWFEEELRKSPRTDKQIAEIMERFNEVLDEQQRLWEEGTLYSDGMAVRDKSMSQKYDRVWSGFYGCVHYIPVKPWLVSFRRIRGTKTFS
jgi:hypothetical protein